MNKKKLVGLVSVFAILAVMLVGCGNAKPKVELMKDPYQKTEFHIGTITTIRVWDKDKKDAVKDAFARIAKSDKQMSVNGDGSLADKINAAAGEHPVKVPTDMWPLFEKAKYYSENSGGVFDASIGAFTNLWRIGFPDAHVPAQKEIDAAKPLVGWKKNVVLDEKNHTVFLKQKGVRLDFGGIAKGYIADQVWQTLKQHGVTTAVIDLGGNLVVMGKSPAGKNKDWNVGIQSPTASRGDAVGYVPEHNKSVVTAGIYEKFLKTKDHTYIYLIDPATGYPYENNLAGVSIVSDKSVNGDALSNVAFNKGLKGGLAYMNELHRKNGTEAIFITKDKKLYLTDGLKKTFKVDKNSGYTLGDPTDIR